MNLRWDRGGNSYLLQGKKDADSGLAPQGKARYIYGFQFKTQEKKKPKVATFGFIGNLRVCK